MRKWVKYVIAGLIAAAGAAGLLYRELQPSRHFEEKQHPVVASPAADLPDSASASAGGQPQPTPEQPKEPQAEEDHSGNFNVLILGLDTLGQQSSRSDVIMLSRVKPQERKVNMVSIPRDTRVQLPGIGLTKVNHAHFMAELKGGSEAGTDASIQAVSNLLQVPVHYYVKMNFKGFVDFIDEIGGVDIEIPADIYLSTLGQPLSAGRQHFDGWKALAFVRERYSLDNGDFGRQADQSALVRAVVQKLLSPERLPDLPGLIKKAKQNVIDTNLSDSDIISLTLMFKDLMPEDMVHVQLPGHPLTAQDPLVGQPLWYWEPDLAEVRSIGSQYLR
ncbi:MULTISPECIES: LCP family protein [Paenibacillus]|uniref:LCP family protein n=1 Tax=Paenibacillus TaxID=44249 RepID=UPI0022B91E49|nr:LCP family protein [Paenibacillus caseinilyticus]MCZ8517978.1 LCP family protein [Paenibacillus caseinilyticus]